MGRERCQIDRLVSEIDRLVLKFDRLVLGIDRLDSESERLVSEIELACGLVVSRWALAAVGDAEFVVGVCPRKV